MPWAKLDDRFWIHPSITRVGNTSAGVFARMVSYCGSFLTDGVVPAEIAQMIAGRDTRALTNLVENGLVDQLESGGYYIPDYLDYNRSRELIEAERENAKKRMRGHRPGNGNGKGHA